MMAGKLLLVTLLGGGTALAGAATAGNVGVERAEEQVRLREESAQSRQHGFFHGYHRSHRGGGLRGGK